MYFIEPSNLPHLMLRYTGRIPKKINKRCLGTCANLTPDLSDGVHGEGCSCEPPNHRRAAATFRREAPLGQEFLPKAPGAVFPRDSHFLSGLQQNPPLPVRSRPFIHWGFGVTTVRSHRGQSFSSYGSLLVVCKMFDLC